MKSGEHAVLGAVASAVAVRAVGQRLSRPLGAVLWAYGVALSVFVDLDHFVIARRIAGDWRHLRRVLADPGLVLFRQEEVFDVDFRGERLASHVGIGTALTLAWIALAPAVAVITVVVVTVHVVADVLRDVGLA
jgi:hypothetical protein